MSFSTKCYVFFEDCNVPKNWEILHFVNGEWTSITNGSFLRFFLFLLPFRNSIMTNNTYFKKLNNLSFSTNLLLFFLKIAMYQKIAKFSTLSTGVKLNQQIEVFFYIFSFYYHLGTVSCQITVFHKTLIIWVFQRNFMFFCEDCNVPKNCEIIHFVHGSEAQSQIGSFLGFLLFLLPFRNSIMTNNIISKNSIIWVFQRNFMFFLKTAMYQKIAKFSTLSTGV